MIFKQSMLDWSFGSGWANIWLDNGTINIYFSFTYFSDFMEDFRTHFDPRRAKTQKLKFVSKVFLSLLFAPCDKFHKPGNIEIWRILAFKKEHNSKMNAYFSIPYKLTHLTWICITIIYQKRKKALNPPSIALTQLDFFFPFYHILSVLGKNMKKNIISKWIPDPQSTRIFQVVKSMKSVLIYF